MRRYLQQDSTELPQFYIDKMRSDLGPFWQHLPPEAVHHDAYAFLNKSLQAPSDAALRPGSTVATTNTIQTAVAAAKI